jgi:DNA-binding response OmpR family regulator
MNKILIIEDDNSIQKLLSTLFKVQGFEISQAYSMDDAIKVVSNEGYDIVLVDVMLGDGSGFDFAKDYLNKLDIPYIFLTAVDDVYDKIEAINMGADDYIEKPFEPLEVLARVNMVLRRKVNSKKELICIGNVEVDMKGYKVISDGLEIDLTNKEFGLLKYFIENKSRVLTRENILENVWGYDYYGNTRTVDMHVKELRKKLQLDCIKTVYKSGYRME